jgi:hypothetical protein
MRIDRKLTERNRYRMPASFGDRDMAKKLNSLAARVLALEKALAGLFSSNKTGAKKVRKKGKKHLVKKPATGKTKTKPKAKAKKASPAKASKKVKRPLKRRVSPPTIEQLTPSGAPQFVTPMENL